MIRRRIRGFPDLELARARMRHPLLREPVLAFRRDLRRLGGNEPELVVLVLAEDGEKTLDGFLVADQHYPAILGEFYIGGVEVPLLRGQPDLVHTSSCTATLSRCLGCSTVFLHP
jgi:hypothetical protein